MKISPIISYEHKLAFVYLKDIINQFDTDLINELNLYGLIKNNKINLSNTDTKRLLQHHLIYNVCESVIYIKKHHKTDVCILYNELLDSKSELKSYINEDSFNKLISSIIKKIQTNLYILFYQTELEINQNNLEYGEILDILNLIIMKMSTMATKKSLGFSKISQFSKKCGLKFLNEQYFNQLSTKYLLI